MALIEICNSTFDHAPISSISSKKYYKHRFKNKIICEECLNAYIDEASKTLSYEIYKTIKSSQSKNDTHDNYFTIEYERDLFSKFMEYILPIKFELHISLAYREELKYDTTDRDTSLTAISTISNNPTKIIHLGRAKISPIVGDTPYISFDLTLDILDTDNEQTIADYIRNYLMQFVNTIFNELPTWGVQNIMNDQSTSIYSSVDATSAKSPECSNCGADVTFESYIYNSKVYCLDCMYDIVVKAAVENNLTDMLGLSIMDNNTSNYAIVNNAEWKRSIIDKYINTMASYGIKLNITRYKMTVC